MVRYNFAIPALKYLGKILSSINKRGTLFISKVDTKQSTYLMPSSVLVCLMVIDGAAIKQDL